MTHSIALWLVLATSQIFFHQLPTHLDQEVSIRGFVYQMEGGQWVLAPQPGVKSCCVSKTEKIVLSGYEGEVSIYRAINLKGRLIKEGEEYLLVLD